MRNPTVVYVVVQRTGERLRLVLPLDGILDFKEYVATGQVKPGDEVLLEAAYAMDLDLTAEPDPPPPPTKRGRVPSFIATRNARHFKRKGRR